MKSCVSSQLPEFPQPPSNLWTPLVKSSHKPLSERATCHKKCSHHKLSQKMFPSTSDVTSYHVTLSHLGKGVCQLKFLRKDQQDGLMTECDPGSRKWTVDLDGSVALHPASRSTWFKPCTFVCPSTYNKSFNIYINNKFPVFLSRVRFVFRFKVPIDSRT